MFRCLAKKNGDLDIEVMGEIGPDCVSESYVLAQLARNPKATVNVAINSDGGDVVEGLKIFEAISLHRGLTVGLVRGTAASMASVLLQACKLRRATMSSVVMIHNPWTMPPPGDYRVFKSLAATLESWTTALAEIYSKRTGQPIETVLTDMGAETWMPAKMALEKGYLDEVIDTIPVKQTEIAALRLEKFKSPPEELVRAVALARKGVIALDPFKEVCKMLGLEESATLEDVQSVLKALVGEEPPGEELPPEEAVAASNIPGKTQAVILAALTSVKDKAKAAVRALVEANPSKFTPPLEKWALGQPIEVVKAYLDAATDVTHKASSQKPEPKGATKEGEMTDAERAVAKATGVSASKVRAYLAKKEKELV
jgi:ATP-dependent protease ClpP protease subunit